MADNLSERQTVCQRVLTRDADSIRSEVVIRLLEPEFAPEEYVGEFRCAFEIDGLDAPIRDYGYGIDSLQAFVSANTRATYALWPFRAQLRWLDSSYDWSIAHCVQIHDGGRRRRLRDVLDEEEEACADLVRGMELIRRASAARMSEQRASDTEREINFEERLVESSTSGPAERDAIAESMRKEPVCTRRLTRGFTTSVQIKLWRPVPLAERGDDHLGVFQVLGAGNDARGTALGSDAMQAMFLAMRGVDSRLIPWRDDLRWFDLPYEDPAQFPNVLDGGRERRIHAIIEEEIYAIEQRRRLQQEMHEQQQAHADDARP